MPLVDVGGFRGTLGWGRWHLPQGRLEVANVPSVRDAGDMVLRSGRLEQVFGVHVDELTAEVMASLVANAIPEAFDLDYKLALYGRGDSNHGVSPRMSPHSRTPRVESSSWASEQRRAPLAPQNRSVFRMLLASDRRRVCVAAFRRVGNPSPGCRSRASRPPGVPSRHWRGAMLVKDGRSQLASSESSKETTETSSGTRKDPRRRAPGKRRTRSGR